MSSHASTLLSLKHRCCALSCYSRIPSSRSWSKTLLLSTGHHSVRTSRYLASSPHSNVSPAYRRHTHAEDRAKRHDGGRQAAPRLDQKSASNRIDALLRLEHEVSEAVARYQKVLDQKGIDCLTTTEEDYKAIASKLRRLVYGWSQFHRYFHTEGCIIERQTPPQRAERYLKQLESLRYTRSQLGPLLNTNTDDSHNQTEKRTLGLFDGLKSFFVSSDEDTDPQDQETRQKAHCSRKYSADTRMYQILMESYLHWRCCSVSPLPGQKNSGSNVSYNDIRRNMPRNHNIQEKEDQDSTTTETKITQKRAQDATNHLMLMHNEMVWFCKAGNTFVKPNQKVNHLIMNRCVDAGSYKYVEIALRLLHQMVFDYCPTNHTLTKLLVPNRCQADLTSYHIVLRACKRAAQLDQKDGKKGAVSIATKLLLELESMKQSQREMTKVGVVDDNPSDEKLSKAESNSLTESHSKTLLTAGPDLATYTLTIGTLVFAGHQTLPDLCKRVDDILFRMMGNKHFVDWMLGHTKSNGDKRHDKRENRTDVKDGSYRETESLSMRAKKHLEPDMMLLQYVLLAYARSNDPVYLNRAKQILQIMKERRLFTVRMEDGQPKYNQKSNRLGTGHDWGSSDLRFQDSECCHLNTWTYNAIIRGFFFASRRRGINVAKEDAIYATNLLDDMMSHGFSFPNKHTFDDLLLMWANTNFGQSGEEAEKLLSRMEVQTASTKKGNYKAPKPNWISYMNALKCWKNSAFALEPGAALRALVLLDKIETQCSFCDKSQEDDEKTGFSYDKHILLNHHVYTAVIGVCSKTHLGKDKPDALRIALVVYNRMIENGVPCTSKTYATLLSCCRTILPPDMRMDFSKAVFDAACTNGKVNRRLLLNLQVTNPQVHKEYRSHPDHSTGFFSNS